MGWSKMSIMPSELFKLLWQSRLQFLFIIWWGKWECIYNDETLSQNHGQEFECSARETSHRCQPLSLYAQFMLAFMSILCVWGSLGNVNHHQSRPFYQPGLYFLLPFYYFDVNFYSTDWKRNWNRTGNRKQRSFLWSNTVPYPSCQAQIPLHLLIFIIIIAADDMKCVTNKTKVVLD